MTSKTALHIVSIILLLLLSGSCKERGKSARSILPKGAELHTGDVVFRLGGGVTSHAVLFADRNGMYSHVGIVVDSAGMKMIVHAVPDEPDFEGDPDRVKMETPERFYSSVNALNGAVCRPTSPQVAAEAARYAVRTYLRGTLFDHEYNGNDTMQMYCTELIVHAFAHAGHPLVGKPQHDFQIPGKRVVCWLPSDIYRSDYVKPVIIF